jgi:hypothetical protein
MSAFFDGIVIVSLLLLALWLALVAGVAVLAIVAAVLGAFGLPLAIALWVVFGLAYAIGKASE